MEALCPTRGAGQGWSRAAPGSLIAQLFCGTCGQWGPRQAGINRDSQCHHRRAGRASLASVHDRPTSMPGLVSVYSTGPQGLVSLSSKSWPVKRPPWLWPKSEDFQASVLLKFLQSLSWTTLVAMPAQTPYVLLLLRWWPPQERMKMHIDLKKTTSK